MSPDPSVMMQEVPTGIFIGSEGVCIAPVDKNSLAAVFLWKDSPL